MSLVEVQMDIYGIMYSYISNYTTCYHINKDKDMQCYLRRKRLIFLSVYYLKSNTVYKKLF